MVIFVIFPVIHNKLPQNNKYRKYFFVQKFTPG